MSDKSHEKISNLMDGELDAQASRFLLKRLASDSKLSSTWGRYHIIQSCLQKSKEEPLAIDIVEKVSQEIRKAPVEQEVRKALMPRWLKPVAGLGIAATVAFMSVIVIQNREPITQPSVVATETVTAAVQPAIEVNVPSAQLVGASRTVPSYLSRYPSLSAKESSLYNQNIQERNQSRPYVYIINHTSRKATEIRTPLLKNKDIAD